MLIRAALAHIYHYKSKSTAHGTNSLQITCIVNLKALTIESISSTLDHTFPAFPSRNTA